MKVTESRMLSSRICVKTSPKRSGGGWRGFRWSGSGPRAGMPGRETQALSRRLGPGRDSPPAAAQAVGRTMGANPGQTPVKGWSNAGQTLVKDWSNAGQRLPCPLPPPPCSLSWGYTHMGVSRARGGESGGRGPPGPRCDRVEDRVGAEFRMGVRWGADFRECKERSRTRY